MPGVQQEGLQVEEQITTSNNRERKKPDKELENTEEDEFTEEKKIREEDGAKQDDEFNREQAAVKVEASEWPVEEPRKEIHISSEEPVIDTEENVAEKQNEVGITEELETLQEAHMATNEIEESVVDELQIALEDSDCVTGQTGDIMDEEVEVNVGGEIKIHSEKANIVTSKTKKQKKVPDVEEIQTPLEDSSTVTTKTEEAAMEKQVELTPAQEMEKGSEETDTLLNIIDEVFNEEHAEHAPDEIHNVSNEVSNAEIKSQEDGNAEQESETAVEKIQIPSDERDTATNGNVNNQMRDVIPTETEQEAVEELTAASAKESVVSEKSVEEV